jgi:tetratricopeptide (TPR) repeat protein
MATEQKLWLQDLAVPERPTVPDIRAFFHVPPDPESKLDDNIRDKRRAWNAKVRSRKATAGAHEQVRAAVKLIDFLARALKRGGDGPIDLGELNDVFREAPRTRVGELGELWEVIERLLAAGKLEEALKLANASRERFVDSTVPHLVFAWVAAQASRFGAADDRLREDALRSADLALADDEPPPEAFLARATLLLDLRRGEEALATLEDAERRLSGRLDTSLEVLLVEALVAGGKLEEAVRRAIDAVEEDPDNLAARSSVTTSLVRAVQFSLLPIRSPDDLARYQRVVEVAAWCAQGAPEAEDLVRPFRMWGVVADNRMYAGDVATRAYSGVLTGFLILPLLNRAQAKAQWTIIADGPDAVNRDVFDEVALGAVSRHVHEPIKDRLPWWEAYFVDVARQAAEDGKRAA